MLFIHVVIAITSLFMSTFAMLRPSHTALRTSLGLVGLTVASGTYVAFTLHASLLHLCMSGLIYSLLTTAALLVARRRLAFAGNEL